MQTTRKNSIHIDTLEKSLADAKIYWTGHPDPQVFLALPGVAVLGAENDSPIEIRIAADFQELALIIAPVPGDTVVVLGTTEGMSTAEVSSLLLELQLAVDNFRGIAADIALCGVCKILSRGLGGQVDDVDENRLAGQHGLLTRKGTTVTEPDSSLQGEFTGMSFDDLNNYMVVHEYASDRAWRIAIRQNGALLFSTAGRALEAVLKVTQARKAEIVASMMEYLGQQEINPCAAGGSAAAINALRAWNSDGGAIHGQLPRIVVRVGQGASNNEPVVITNRFASDVLATIAAALIFLGEGADPDQIQWHAKVGLEKLTERVIEKFLMTTVGVCLKITPIKNVSRLDFLLNQYRLCLRFHSLIERLAVLVRHPRENLFARMGGSI